jgi:hypothetical protein
MYPQDADLYGNEDLKYVIAHPTGHTGVFPVVEGDDIVGVEQECNKAFKAYPQLGTQECTR